MSNYEKFEKVKGKVIKAELIAWGILSIILALMAVGISKETIPYVMGIAALLSLPGIIVGILVDVLIEEHFWRKDFEEEEAD